MTNNPQEQSGQNLSIQEKMRAAVEIFFKYEISDLSRVPESDITPAVAQSLGANILARDIERLTLSDAAAIQKDTPQYMKIGEVNVFSDEDSASALYPIREDVERGNYGPLAPYIDELAEGVDEIAETELRENNEEYEMYKKAARRLELISENLASSTSGPTFEFPMPAWQVNPKTLEEIISEARGGEVN